jgi:hypothetical protein
MDGVSCFSRMKKKTGSFAVTAPASTGNDRAADTVDSDLPHPRTLTWVGTAALAMGGSNQSLFLLSALFIGQGAITGQGSVAIRC